jgi:integrase
MSIRKAQRNTRPSVFPSVFNAALTEAELQQLLAAAQNASGMQDLSNVITIVSNTGIRIGELVRLPWSSVNLDDILLFVADTKSSDTRMVPFEAESRKAFAALHARRPESDLVLGNSPSGVHHRMSRQLRTLSAQIGMRPVAFHLIRHTFFTRLAAAGAPALVIKAIGGWKSWGIVAGFFRVSEPVIKREYDAALRKAL